MQSAKEIMAQTYWAFFLENKERNLDSTGACIYNHYVNKYGCGVGGLMPNWMASKFDGFDGAVAIKTIYNLYYPEHPTAKTFFDKMFEIFHMRSKSEVVEFLQSLQNWHDRGIEHDRLGSFKQLCNEYNFLFADVVELAERWKHQISIFDEPEFKGSDDEN